MRAALGSQPTSAGFAIGQPLLLAGGKGRIFAEATVKELPHADEPRYCVTLDDGHCAGLRLWACESELTPRRATRPETRQ